MLLDTSGIFAYHHVREASHAKAKLHLESSSSNLIHSLVLAEFIPLATARKLARNSALEFISLLMDHPNVEVVWCDRLQILNAFAFLEQRLVKSYSLCDAVSFQLMRERGINEALTTDQHFEQEGFTALLR